MNKTAQKKLRIATRKSALALWQANFVKGEILKNFPNLDIELIPVTTSGDTIVDVSLSKIGGKGLFVKELEEKLLNNEADIAVHSMKDVPSELPEGLKIGCILEREDPRDALLSKKYSSINSLPKGAKVGTSSLRRQAQMARLRGDVELVSLRGNVDTRIRKMLEGEFDAIILAYAGLKRLNLMDEIREILDPEIMLPGVGQGALGIECRDKDLENDSDENSWISDIILSLHHEQTGFCVQAERSMNALLGGSCQLPVAGLATLLDNGFLHLQGMVASPDGKTILKAEQKEKITVINDALDIGEKVAKELLQMGADKIIEQCVIQ